MKLEFHDTDRSIGEHLQETLQSIQGKRLSMKQVLELIGEQGLLLFCIILTLPFMLPMSIPGVSTAFGLLIILIGIGITLNRIPWLPSFLMQREITGESLSPVLNKGIEIFGWLERWIRPRLMPLSESAFINRLNGMVLTAAGILLLFPLSFIPFSNTLPALAVLLVAIGIAERDGYFILAAYVALVLTVVYFGGLALLAYWGGMMIFA